jgi:predicted  nucleic acid-binding Zn-ribbon protein
MSTKDELRQVEEDLAKLRAQVKDLRAQVSDMGATDQVETSAMIGMADEQEELIAGLERRRDELLRRLDEG